MIDRSIVESRKSFFDLADFSDARYFGNGPVRSVASGPLAPPPPDPPAKTVNGYEARQTGTLPKIKIEVAPEPEVPKARKPYKQNRQSRVMTEIDGQKVSVVAISPCIDGGAHEWHPHCKKQAICSKCEKHVTKKFIPDLVLVRRPKVARTELPPCKDPRGHAPILSRDGKNRQGVLRLRCNRCDQTRAATPAENEVYGARMLRRKKGMTTHHCVEYLMPGSLFSEEVSKIIESRDVDLAMRDLPRNAFAFTFYDVETRAGKLEDGAEITDRRVVNKSKKYYPGGKAYNIEEAAAEVGEKSTLISNMRCNDYATVVKTRLGNWQPLFEGDVIL